VDDRIKTSFTWDCKFGRKFMFAGAPFGIKPLTQRFQAAMEKILEPVSKFVLVYVDDIIIFSDGSIEDHAQKVSSVLDLLSSHNLRVNREKCHLGFKRLRFLGHLLSGTQRTPDPRKLANLSGFSRPKTGKQIMAYLGFVNYLREYIPLYSKTASPLEKLRKTKTITDDIWTPACEAAFTQFRSVLCSAPVLSFPKDDVPFIVATDASQYGVGAVLYQEYEGRRHYISFASLSSTKGQKNYSATRRELLAIVFALKTFHDYIWGTKFTLLTDHKALTFLFTQKHVNFMLRSWLDFLIDYSFDVVHCPGLLNVLPDCLSRLYDNEKDESASVMEPQVSVVLYGKTPFRVMTQSISALKLEVPYTDDEIKKVIRDRLDKQDVLPDERQDLLEQYHIAGHFGAEYLFRKLWDDGYYWMNMKADCTEVISKCVSCQRFNMKRGSYRPLRPVSATYPFDHIAIDLAGPFPNTTARGHNMILVMVDVATRFVILRPLKSKTMQDVARALWEVFTDFGFPKIMQSDRGSEFVNKVLSELTKLSGIDHRLVAPYNPSANGLAERFVSTSKSVLKKLVQGEWVDWDLYLPSVQMSMNYKVSSLVGASPHSLMFTRPTNALKSYVNAQSDLMDVVSMKKHASDALEILYPEVCARANDKRATMAATVDKKRKQHIQDFAVGDTVMVVDERRNSKLDPVYEGPYKVASLDERNGTYRLTDMNGVLLKTIYPSQKLKIIAPIIDDDEHYVVESIVAHRGSANKRQYLVKWKGYSSDENTWESVSMFDSPVMISDYWKRVHPKRSK
jgi:transposase InsO family protein